MASAGEPPVRLRVTVNRHVTVRRASRRDSNTLPLLALLGLVSAVAAIAAGIAHHENAARALRYTSDGSCQTTLVGNAPAMSIAGVCSIDTAIVTRRWVHYTNNATPHYELAVRTPDGRTDSLELTGVNDHRLWTLAVPQTTVLVQRFADDTPTPSKHVTLVRAGGLTARTDWNPARRNDDTEAGVAFFSLVCVASLVAISRVRRRRRTAAPLAA